ncbi:MAG: sigma 54-interacting transcriptional regulator [Myxococcales bacterium]|jgi:DNA-binding NtrC family response regulator|nr:sigma 54-interacting transcriptional regulator [Myxococcales bacterium]
MAELVFFRRREELMRVSIDAGRRVIIGRAGSCDVVVPDPAVARAQLAIEGDAEGRFWLTDLSGKGSLLCGVTRAAAELLDGHDIELGEWRAIFHPTTASRDGGQTRSTRPRADTTRLFDRPEREKSQRSHARRRSIEQTQELPMFWDRLVVRGRAELDRPSAERVVPCPERLVIGSDIGCDLVLADPFVSACHALLERRGQVRWLRDLKSSNGTFLGRSRIVEAEMPFGVPARIGHSELVLTPPEQGHAEISFEGLIGGSPAMREVFSIIERVAPSEVTALIVGESGTGKELVARALHARSGRAEHPFVPINCGALNEGIIESELFGHEKGAFTGADKVRRGAFEEASGGTLFLDEIGELPLNLQAKLLRALELREIKRVGASLPQRVDVRVVGATNRDLRSEVAARRFREDLYWRLAAIPIALPPLRARGEQDLRALVRHFLKSFTAVGCSIHLSAEAEARLLAHTWPGNVRELKNCLNRTLLLRRSDVIEARDIFFDEGFGGFPATIEATPATPASVSRASAGRDANASSCIDIAGKTFAQIEEEVFVRTSERLGFKVSAIARALGQSRGTIYRRMEKLGIGPGREPEE